MVAPTDPCKAVFWITAIYIFLLDLSNDRTKIAILFLESVLIFRDKLIKEMKEYPVENHLFRTPGSIDSCHGSNKASRNGPKCRKDLNLLIF